jgi:hypothetical protein
MLCLCSRCVDLYILGDFLILDCIAVLPDIIQDPRCPPVALLGHISGPRAKTWLFYASSCHTDMQGLMYPCNMHVEDQTTIL